jgi:hypothetical protein
MTMQELISEEMITYEDCENCKFCRVARERKEFMLHVNQRLEVIKMKKHGESERIVVSEFRANTPNEGDGLKFRVIKEQLGTSIEKNFEDVHLYPTGRHVRDAIFVEEREGNNDEDEYAYGRGKYLRVVENNAHHTEHGRIH